MEETGVYRGSPDRDNGFQATVVTVEQEAILISFHKHTRLPLGDLSLRLAGHHPATHSLVAHRCLERQGIGRLPEVEGGATSPQEEVRSLYDRLLPHLPGRGKNAEGKVYLMVAIDRTSKFAVVKLVKKAEVRAGAPLLQALVEAVPYRIHTVLTDNGIPIADLPKNRGGGYLQMARTSLRPAVYLHGIETDSPSQIIPGPMRRSSA